MHKLWAKIKIPKGSKKRKNSDPNDQKSDKSEPNGQKGLFSRPFRGQKSDVFDRKC